MPCEERNEVESSQIYFSKAAVTNYLQFSGLKQHKCILLQLWRFKFEMDLDGEGAEIR